MSCMSDWLTDVAFLHLSIENDQSFDLLDGFICKLPHPGEDTMQRLVFTSHVHGLLCFSCTIVLVGLRIDQEVFKVLSLVYSKKRKPTVSYAPYSEQAFPFVQSTTGDAPPSAAPSRTLQTTLHHSLPNLRCLVYILSATTLLNQGFLKKHFFTFINIKKVYFK